MTVRVDTIETEDGLYEQSYSITLMGGTALHFTRRPVAITPPEGTVCFVDNGPKFGDVGRRSVGEFKDGKWCRAKFEPTHWTVFRK